MKNIFKVFLVVFLFLLCSCGPQFKFKSFAPTPERGDIIGGYIIKPSGDGPFPGVIILHGCSGVKDNDYQWANRLSEWGYAALILDSYSSRGISNNCGESKSKGYFYKAKISALERALDAHAAKSAFGELPYVDRNKIGVMGYSQGGRTVFEAIKHNFVAYTLPEDSRDPFKAAVALYPMCMFTAETNVDLLILAGDEDDWAPGSLCKEDPPEPFDANTEVVVKVYPGATHSFDMDKPDRTYRGYKLRYSPSAMADAVPRVKAFFDKHLKAE